MLRIVLLGPPASGKGTHARLLADNLGLGYLSTGALLREHVEAGTELGQLATPILARGGYLPDDLMSRILADWLESQPGGWVLDGFPRSLPQAIFLDELLEKSGLSLSAAVALEAPFENLVVRIQTRVECSDCRWTGSISQSISDQRCPQCLSPVMPRPDDTLPNFTNRHQEFERLTIPAIDHYRQAGVLFSCDATAPQAAVAKAILDHFSEKLGIVPV